MHVVNKPVKELLEGQVQYQIPIWQRSYAWEEKQLLQLWEDIIWQHGRTGDSVGPGHYLGSLVVADGKAPAAGVTTHEVIDGQQRMTSIILLLCAIRDALKEAGDEDTATKINENYLVNRLEEGDKRLRLLPRGNDRDAMRTVVLGGSGDLPPGLIRSASEFFARQVAGLEAPDLADIAACIVSQLNIVAITSEPEDNTHRIFESINWTGKKIENVDLVRNHLFMLLPNRADAVYEDVWKPLEEKLGPGNLAKFISLDLDRRGMAITEEGVYPEHVAITQPFSDDEAQVEDRVRDLALWGGLFDQLLKAEHDSPAVVDCLKWLARWGDKPWYSVGLVSLKANMDGGLSDEDLASALALIESFYVRRYLANRHTQGLNRRFPEIAGRLPHDDKLLDALHSELSRESLRWPSDTALREEIRSAEFYLMPSAHKRKLILERLEQHLPHEVSVDFEGADLQVEHVMPQTLNDEWRKELEDAGDSDPEDAHAKLVHNLGNMTLTAWNGTLSNNPFERKKQIYSDSNLKLNLRIAESEVWGSAEIRARAEELGAALIEIWASPIDEVGEDDDTSDADWSRIDAAVMAIPLGRWTSYGDLADLGGTAALPVGGRMVDLGEDFNAYRVLKSDGTVSEHFRWKSSDDKRDPREVLESEGVEFDEKGRASQSQHIGAAEIAGLLPDEADPGSGD